MHHIDRADSIQDAGYANSTICHSSFWLSGLCGFHSVNYLKRRALVSILKHVLSKTIFGIPNQSCR